MISFFAALKSGEKTFAGLGKITGIKQGNLKRLLALLRTEGKVAHSDHGTHALAGTRPAYIEPIEAIIAALQPDKELTVDEMIAQTGHGDCSIRHAVHRLLRQRKIICTERGNKIQAPLVTR